MICYLDTSAMVKLYVREEGSEDVRALVRDSMIAATCKVAYAEARAALARVWREGALEDQEYRYVLSELRNDWEHYLRIEVSDALVMSAGELAETHCLRGFDALHLAAVLLLKHQVEEPSVVVACWDKRLWQSVQQYGITTLPKEL